MNRAVPKEQWPGWIELMYKRQSAAHALSTAHLLDGANELIAEHADALADGRDRLRQVALGELASTDPQIVALSLVFLGVVGRREDVTSVERLLDHPSDLVSRAARTCKFELERA